MLDRTALSDAAVTTSTDRSNPSAFNTPLIAFVLGVLTPRSLTTRSEPSAAFAESSERIANRRIFFGRSFA